MKGRAEFVRGAIASVSAQTLDALEVLLCDDDSDPETLEILHETCRSDRRVRLIARGDRPRGGSARRNDGVSAAIGQYLVFLDSDDVLRPDCLENRVAWMRGRPDLAFAVSECRVFERAPGDTPYVFNIASPENDLERFMRHDFPWQTGAPTWRRTSFATIGDWDESLPSWQDWDLHVRALLSGLPYARTGLFDYYYRRTRGVAFEGYVGTEHLHTRRGVLAKISARLVDAGLRRSRASRLLTGLYFDVAWRLACRGYIDEALALWDDAGSFGLARGRLLHEGTMLLRLARRGGLRPMLQKYRFTSWPEDLHHTPSKTLLRTWALPVDEPR